MPLPYTHAAMVSPRSVTLSGPPSPTHIAQTMLDFPVPFGPMMQLSFEPGSEISTSVYTMKLLRATGWLGEARGGAGEDAAPRAPYRPQPRGR